MVHFILLTPFVTTVIILQAYPFYTKTMTTEKLAHYKDLLLKEEARLKQELQDFGQEDPKNPGHFEATYQDKGGMSEDDNAEQISEYADDLSVEAKLEEELRDTESALHAIEEGKYGVCKYCGQEIDEKRLDARPASSSCVSCKKVLTQEL